MLFKDIEQFVNKLELRVRNVEKYLTEISLNVVDNGMLEMDLLDGKDINDPGAEDKSHGIVSQKKVKIKRNEF